MGAGGQVEGGKEAVRGTVTERDERAHAADPHGQLRSGPLVHDRRAGRGVVILLCGEGPAAALEAQKLAEGGQGGVAQPRRLPQQPCLKHGSAALARYAVESVQRVGRRQSALSAPSMGPCRFRLAR